jgi:glycosyltransferase involved in cell wall biosynthesis
MKILQVSNKVPWPLNEGGNIATYNNTQAFYNLGNEVYLYCLDAIKHNTPVKEAQEELSKIATTYIHPINTDLRTDEALKHLLRNESYNVSRFYNSTFKSELKSLLQKESFDVVQLEGTFVGPYIDVIRDHHQGIISLRMHNAEYEIWERLSKNESNPLKKGYTSILAKQLKKYEKKILGKVDVVIPITKNDEEKFKALQPNITSFATPAGVDLNVWKFKPSQGYQKWYHIGSMEWHANKEAISWYLKEVHHLITKEDNSYSLYLAGKGINSVLNNQNCKVIVEERVESAFDFVCKHDVCLVPLKSGSGIRLKILEAMATGKLVISTTIGAQGINYKENEHLLIADEPQDFVNLYKKLRNSEINIPSIVSNARKLIEEEYSTEVSIKHLLSFYKAQKKASL